MKINLLFLLLISLQFAFSQTSEKTVSITTSGTGKTLEEAKNNALRSAIEQAFGAFISSKTEILNDQIISDQITSVASGNIQNFDIKSQDRLPSDIWSVTLSAIVSVDKLISFVQSKGITVEIKGGLFALNVKQQILNENAEIDNVCQLIGNIHEPLQQSFDYVLKASEPVSQDNSNEKWSVNLEVTSSTNDNFNVCMDHFVKTIESIGLNTSEAQNYIDLGKKTYSMILNVNGIEKTIQLRKEESLQALNSFVYNLNNFYSDLFKITWGSASCFYGSYLETKDFFELAPIRQGHTSSYRKAELIIYIPTGKVPYKTYTCRHGLSLAELEKLEKYEVSTLGIVSKFNFGGYVFFDKETYRIDAMMNEVNPHIIDSVIIGGAAYEFGLQKNDEIISINGISLSNHDISELILKSTDSNKKSNFEIIRQSQTLIIEVTPKHKKYTLIASPITFGQSTGFSKNIVEFSKAKENCEKLILNGFQDWVLPNYNQMLNLRYQIGKNGIGNIHNHLLDFYVGPYSYVNSGYSDSFWCINSKPKTNGEYSTLTAKYFLQNDEFQKNKTNPQNIKIDFMENKQNWECMYIPIRILDIEIK